MIAATLPTIQPALVAELNKGNEGALERLFREQYEALLSEAMLLLQNDGASAARGVENVFTQVWEGREEFTTPEMLETYLREAVHEAAARIKSRHAVAHHLGEYEGAHSQKAAAKPAPSVDEAWAKVYHAVHVDAVHAAEVAHKMADHSRHEAAGQIVELSKPRPIGPMIAMGVVVVGAIVAFTLWASRGHEAAALTEALAASTTRSIGTGMAEFNNVTLSDHSTVKLGPDSRLLIPQGFGSSIRGLKLEGTATFTVAPGQDLKFIVRAGNAIITATGTEFSVRAYADEHDVAVRVTEGDVTATVGDSARSVAKGNALVIAANGAMHEAAATDVEQAFGWTDGTVFAANRPLRDVVVLAKRWFGLALFVPDTSLLDRSVTMRAPIGVSTEAVASIEKSGGLRKVWEGTNMVLKDATRPDHAGPKHQ